MASESDPSLPPHVPAISQIDLIAFHLLHFPHAQSPSTFPTQDVLDEEDGELGYYEDGVKRTLTDEQIAIFRYSEIETLRRERRHQEEAAAPRVGSKQPARELPEPEMSNRKRRKLNRQKQKQKQNVWRKEKYLTDEGLTTRRIARELDEIKEESKIELDY